MLRLPQRAGAINDRALLVGVIAIVITVVATGILIVKPKLVLQKSIEAKNRQAEAWRADIAEALDLPIDYVQPTTCSNNGFFEIYDERGYCERLVAVDDQNEFTYAYYPATFPLDFTTEAYSPSAMADIVKKELAWFLAEEPENLSCTVQDKELNAADEKPEMLYIHCHNTANDRRYIAEIYYANEPNDIGRGLRNMRRVEEANDPTTH